MFKQALPLAVLLALAACSGTTSNPVNGPDEAADEATDGEETDGTTGIPENLAINVESISLDVGDPTDPSDDMLRVTGLGLDGDVYMRDPRYDTPGFQAYTTQADRLDRFATAVIAVSPDGSVRAGSVGDGGQFNRFFRGNFYERLEPLVLPTGTDARALVSYAGTYSGVTNIDALEQGGEDPLPTDPDRPLQGRQTQGVAFVNVDFQDNRVNGSIESRQFTDGRNLASLALIDTELTANGEWSGTEVEFLNQPNLGDQGDHGGILGGENAAGLAGVIQLENVFEPSDPLEAVYGTFDKEVGAFVLQRCGTENAPDVCNGLGDVE